MDAMHTMPVRLSADAFDRLRRLAFDRHVAMAALIRQAVDDFLTQEADSGVPDG